MSDKDVKELRKEIYLLMHNIREMLEFTQDGFLKNRLSSLNQADDLSREIRVKAETLTAAIAKSASTDDQARSLLTISFHLDELRTSIGRIVENSRVRIREGLLFSDKAISEASSLFVKTDGILKNTADSAVTGSPAAVTNALEESESLERMTSAFATAHEQRLITGECQPRASSIYLSILYAFEDLRAHLKNAARKLPVR
jgi:Na+/phosphate symporter